MRNVIKFCLVLTLSFISTIAFAFNDKTKVEGNSVKYNGDTFTFSNILHQYDIKKELAEAQVVYVFRISDITDDVHKLSDWCDTYINSSTGEFAINFWAINTAKNCNIDIYVVFSKYGVRVVDELPEGFKLNFDEIVDYGPYGKKLDIVMVIKI